MTWYSLLYVPICLFGLCYGNFKTVFTREQLKLIKQGKTFTCANNEKTIPLTWLNDDYCDCMDGSDENRTSACRNGVFLCRNKKYKARQISSAKVNDGVCDCCDGSDEYLNRVECPDVCEYVKNQELARNKERFEILWTGLQIKDRLIEAGSRMKQDITIEINVLKNNVTAFEIELERLNHEKADLESAADLKRQQAETASRHRIYCKILFESVDQNNDSKVNTKELIDAGKYFIDLVQNMSETKEHSSHLTSGINLQYFEQHIYPHVFKSGTRNEYNLSDSSKTDDGQHRHENEEGSIEEQFAVDEYFSGQISEIGKQVNEMSELISKAKAKIEDYNSMLSINFGKNSEFLTMYGKELKLENNEYIYELNLFKTTHQVSKQNKQSICIGRWSKWKEPTANENQKGINLIMQYDNGDNCWNGPSRSTNVYLLCGKSDGIIEVKESVRCSYEMYVVSPAACFNRTNLDTNGKDEL